MNRICFPQNALESRKNETGGIFNPEDAREWQCAYRFPDSSKNKGTNGVKSTNPSLSGWLPLFSFLLPPSMPPEKTRKGKPGTGWERRMWMGSRDGEEDRVAGERDLLFILSSCRWRTPPPLREHDNDCAVTLYKCMFQAGVNIPSFLRDWNRKWPRGGKHLIFNRLPLFVTCVRWLL